ncbi:MAG: hypothetical protein JNK64_08335 [Myxococcales bacterium]|nr:hypothetical protein [Myxococcales bacterium]
MFATRPAIAAAFLATTLVATVAHADGPPGACECGVTPTPDAPSAAPRPSLPRWGVGAHLASVSLAEPGAMDDRGTPYAGAGLQLRYRLRPRWQLELTAAHVQEQDVDEAVARHVDAAALAILFHPRPYARWDLYLLAGLGATSDGDPDLTDAQREASQVGDVQLGAGVERRFGRIGVAAELRLLAREPADDGAAARMTDGTGATTDDAQRSGGALTIGASYYF